MPATAAAIKSAPGFDKNPDYKIKIDKAGHRVTASIGDLVVADTKRALIMIENDYKPVYYFPRNDVHLEHFERTEHSTYCAYKGKASYWSIKSRHDKSDNAAWSYETPYRESAGIKDYIGFYASKVDVTADN